MTTISNQKGASIIAVIAIMLILAVMGATLVSLVTTGSDVSVNQLQSERAFNVAEGGKEYALRQLKENCSYAGEANKALENGLFTAVVTDIGGGVKRVTTTATVGNATRVVVATAQVTCGGEAVTNGTFQNNVNNWTEVNTRTEGTSGWDNAVGNPAGSLRSKTNDCVGNACRGLWFQGYREQILATPIPSGVNVTLQLQYSKSVTLTGGGSATDMSVVIVYQGGGTSTIWSNTSEATIGFTPVNQSFVSANIITGIRLAYNLKNPSGPSGDGAQRKVWFDEVSLTTPSGALSVLTWQESY